MYGRTNEDLIKAVLHECRHCYQHLMEELYIQTSPEQRNLYAFTHEGVLGWIENNNNYNAINDIDNHEEYLKYRDQILEVDARAWSEKRIEEYFSYIDDLTDTIRNSN